MTSRVVDNFDRASVGLLLPDEMLSGRTVPPDLAKILKSGSLTYLCPQLPSDNATKFVNTVSKLTDPGGSKPSRITDDIDLLLTTSTVRNPNQSSVESALQAARNNNQRLFGQEGSPAGCTVIDPIEVAFLSGTKKVRAGIPLEDAYKHAKQQLDRAGIDRESMDFLNHCHNSGVLAEDPICLMTWNGRPVYGSEHHNQSPEYAASADTHNAAIITPFSIDETLRWKQHVSPDTDVVIKLSPMLGVQEVLLYAQLMNVEDPYTDSEFGPLIAQLEAAEQSVCKNLMLANLFRHRLDGFRSCGFKTLIVLGNDPQELEIGLSATRELGKRYDLLRNTVILANFAPSDDGNIFEKSIQKDQFARYETSEVTIAALKLQAKQAFLKIGVQLDDSSSLWRDYDNLVPVFQTLYDVLKEKDFHEAFGEDCIVRCYVGSFPISTPDKPMSSQSPPFEITWHDEEPKIVDIRFNEAHFTQGDAIHINGNILTKLKEQLELGLDGLNSGEQHFHAQMIDRNDVPIPQTAAQRFSSTGYAVAAQARLVLGTTAVNDGFVQLSAKTILDRFRRCLADGSMPESPGICEIGAFAAHGIEQLVQALYDQAKDESQLVEALQKSKLYLVDAQRASLDIGMKVINGLVDEGKIEDGFVIPVLLGDLDKASVLQTYETHGMIGNILTTRLVNVLDAISSEQVRTVQNKPVQVYGRSGIPTHLMDALLNPVAYKEPQYWDTQSEHLDPTPDDFDPETVGLTNDKLLEAAHNALQQSVVPPSLHMVKTLSEKHGVPDWAAGQLYSRFIDSLRVYHSYRPLDVENYTWGEADNAHLLTNIVRSTGYRGPMSAMSNSFAVLSQLSEVVHPTHGAILTAHLASDVLTMNQRDLGDLTLTPTNATKVPRELFDAYVEGVMGWKQQPLTLAPDGQPLKLGPAKAFLINRRI